MKTRLRSLLPLAAVVVGVFSVVASLTLLSGPGAGDGAAFVAGVVLIAAGAIGLAGARFPPGRRRDRSVVGAVVVAVVVVATTFVTRPRPDSLATIDVEPELFGPSYVVSLGDDADVIVGSADLVLVTGSTTVLVDRVAEWVRRGHGPVSFVQSDPPSSEVVAHGRDGAELWSYGPRDLEGPASDVEIAPIAVTEDGGVARCTSAWSVRTAVKP